MYRYESVYAFFSIRRILEKGLSVERNVTTESIEVIKNSDPTEIVDLEQHAKDRIVKYIAANFSGHHLARLVEAILKAQGYITTKSEPGKDGGIDILALS
jgi:restriction system protein